MDLKEEREGIYIKKNGFYLIKFDVKKSAYIRLKPAKSKIFKVLKEPCILENGITLKDIFNAVSEYPLLMNFISQYSSCKHLKEFHKEANKKYEPFKNEKIDYLEIRMIYEEYDKYASIFYDFVGVGIENNEQCYYSVSYTPMFNLSELPVIINEKILTQDKKEKDVEKSASLIDVLDAIYYDISFTGGPEDNLNFIKMIKEISNNLDLDKLN